MPNIAYYADESDGQLLLDWLDDQTDLAFLVLEKEGCWKAYPKLKLLPSLPISIWQVASGSLPLFVEGIRESTGFIDNPYDGWCGKNNSIYPSLPWLGAQYSSRVFDWHLRPKSRFRWDGFWPVGLNTDGTIGRSSFSWVGDRFNSGRNSDRSNTMKHSWAKLRSFVREHAEPIKVADFVESADCFAFPGALKLIREGTPRAPNADHPSSKLLDSFKGQ